MFLRQATFPIAFLVVVCTASLAAAQAFTYQLGGGSEGWPADKRTAIVNAMDEAVSTYNRYGHFEKHDTANYNAGVPTAQGSYNGTIDFGSQFSTRVALHEIAHTLGIGTYWGFDGGTWNEDSAAGRLIKLFDGRTAVLSTGGSHFWPYGLNYDNEDGAAARERHVKLVSAFRFDMGIIQDSDSDGLPDDWEVFHFGSLAQGASGDPDRDGVQNIHEYKTDCDPTVAAPIVDGHTYLLRNQRGQRVLSVVDASDADMAPTEVREETDAEEQRWTAHYLGEGWFAFTNVKSGKRLAVESADVGSGLPILQLTASDSWTQQWRVTTGIGADPDYHQIANRETARLIDAVEATAGAEVKQYPYLGHIAQQYWQFVEVGSEEEDEGEPDGGTSSRNDGGVPTDHDAEDDEGSVDVDRGQADGPDAQGAPNDKPAASGCALSAGHDHWRAGWWFLLALVIGARRRRNRLE